MSLMKSIWLIVNELIKCSKRDFIIVLGIVIFLGIWPSIEVSLIQSSINNISNDYRVDAALNILFLFLAGILILILNNFYPYFQQKYSEKIKEVFTEKYITIVNNTDVESLLYPDKRNELIETYNSISRLHSSGLTGGLALLQTIISSLALSGILFSVISWAPLLILAGVIANIHFTKKAAKFDVDSISSSTDLKRYEKTLLNILTTSKYAKELRMLSITKWLIEKWLKYNNLLIAFTIKRLLKSSIYSIGAGTIGLTLNLIIIVYGVYSLAHGEIQAGDVAALFMSGIYLEQVLQMALSEGRGWIVTGIYLDPLIKKDNHNNEGDLTNKISCIATTTRSTSGSYALQFKNVSFKYKYNDNFAIENISFAIPRGSKIALVGPNGSGKTTLISLASGLFKPCEGEIIRDEIGANILQGYGKYRLNVDENIMIGDINKKEDVQNISKVIDIIRGGFIKELSDREKTLLWEEMGGIQLSEGQWQKISIGRGVFRTLYRMGSIVFLDEPSAVLDPNEELELLKNIMNYFKDYTVIFVVHRLVGCTFADQVMVLNEGKLDAFGTHSEVLQISDLYKSMWKASVSFMS